MSGGSKEQELLSIETYSGNIIGEINKDATNIETQQFIQETTKNKNEIKRKYFFIKINVRKYK